MKHLLLVFLLSMLSINSVLAQNQSNLSEMSQTELEQLKAQAVEDQDYELAQRIKSELAARKTVDELIAAQEAKLETAVQQSDFEQANALKDDIQRLRGIKKQLATLEKNLEKAVAVEDYAAAQSLKQQQEELRQSIYGSRKQGEVVEEPARHSQEEAVDQESESGRAASSKPVDYSLSWPQPGSLKAGQISYKVTGGLTLGDAKFTSDDVSNDLNKYGPKLGIMLAFSMQYQLSEAISAHASLGVLNLGLRTMGADYHYRMNYISSEFMGRMQFAYGAYAAGGFFADYGLLGRQRMPSGKKVAIFSNGGLHRLNVGLSGEAGWNLLLGPYQGELFFSYHLGLNNVEGKFDDDNQKTSLRMLTLGARYYL